MKLMLSDDFHKIVVEDIPLIDVRAEVEFEKGAFLNSYNLPVMNNEERHKVGTVYKEDGSEAAVALGHKLVFGKVKEERVKAWMDFIKNNPKAMIYCFRGGMRSQISQTWIEEESGKSIVRLAGGYKAFRNYLMENLKPDNYKDIIPVVLGGCTGAGKTILLNKLNNFVDLEKIAHHRGSSFGNFADGQPSQINFENNLAFELIKHKNKKYKYMILEDEGRNVGKRFMNESLVKYFNSGDLIILEESMERRVEITFEEYVVKSQEEYIRLYGENGLKEWSDYISGSFHKIRKRLGLEKYKEMLDSFEFACNLQVNDKNIESHKLWIESLLKDYYDPMYNYQISKKTDKILFKGNSKEVLEYMRNLEI